MIASLRGKLIATDLKSIVVECSGVGFNCNASTNTISSLGQIGSDVFVYTYMTVREDAIELAAFKEKEELEFFRLLINVNGVSARIALSLLSEFTADRLALCIASSDAKALQKANGVGAKLAQRIVLELHDKVGSADIGVSSQNVEYVGNSASNSTTAMAVDALVSLGYSKTDASVAVGKLDGTKPLEVLIKEALNILARQV